MEAEAREATEIENLDNNVNHSLGLQDLYKAAFSQECAKVREDPENDLKLFSSKDDYSIQTIDNFGNADIAMPSSQLVYQVFDRNESSVLDLDKGIPVQVVHLNGNEHQPYDTQILQRYLHDASYLRGECSEISTPSTDLQTLKIEVIKNDTEEKKIQLEDFNSSTNYDLQTVKFEAIENDMEEKKISLDDFNFNSSDSFASAESIIPKTIDCPKCPKKFMFKSDLQRHDRNKHSFKQRHVCTICLKEFSSEQHLTFHSRCHMKGNPQKCNLCKRTYKQTVNYIKHMSEVHVTQVQWKCVKCDVILEGSEPLKTHRLSCGAGREESSRPRMGCNLCGKLYSKRSYLHAHIKKNHPEAGGTEIEGAVVKYENERCDMEVVLLSAEGNAEIQMPTVIIPPQAPVEVTPKEPAAVFACVQCPKTFASKRSLNRHIRQIHTNRPIVNQEKRPLENEFRNHMVEIGVDGTKIFKNNNIQVKKQKTTQEMCTQTGEEDLYEMQHVNMVTDSDLSFSISQPIILTSLGGLGSVPIIISQPQISPSQVITQNEHYLNPHVKEEETGLGTLSEV